MPAEDRASFDLELDQHDAGTALDQIAASIGLNRRWSRTGAEDRPEVRQDDVELFIRRDVPAIAGYRLDLERIVSVAEQIVVTASEQGRDFYPHRCAMALAAALNTTLIELPGNHAAMISRRPSSPHVSHPSSVRPPHAAPVAKRTTLPPILQRTCRRKASSRRQAPVAVASPAATTQSRKDTEQLRLISHLLPLDHAAAELTGERLQQLDDVALGVDGVSPSIATEIPALLRHRPTETTD